MNSVKFGSIKLTKSIPMEPQSQHFSWVFYGRIFSGFSSSMAPSFCHMAPGSIMSILIPSNRSQYDDLEVLSNKFEWKVSLEHVKHQKWFTLTKYPILQAIF